jgi:hypothetical protein
MRTFSESIPEHWSHESTLILDEALCFLVMLRHGFAFGIFLNFQAVCFIAFDVGKTEERDCYILRTLPLPVL